MGIPILLILVRSLRRWWGCRLRSIRSGAENFPYLFPSQHLKREGDHGRILCRIKDYSPADWETCILFTNEFTCEQKNNTVYEKLRLAFSKYPDVLGTTNVIQILHISRDTLFESYPSFYCYLMSWSKSTGWKVEEKKIPNTSDILFILGSGKCEFIANYSRYQSGPNKDTSRNVFHCFIDTLFNIKDPSCGGPPQLVGIYRKPESSAKNFGIIYQNKRYFLGAEVPRATYPNKIEWRNEFFELCDGGTKKVIKTAVKQPDLLRRK